MLRGINNAMQNQHKYGLINYLLWTIQI